MLEYLSRIFHDILVTTLLMPVLLLSASQHGYAADGGYVGQTRYTAGDYLAARFAENMGNSTKAARLYGIALSHDPKNTALLQRTYAMYIRAGEIDRAVHLAKRHINASPEAIVPALLLALQDVSSEKFDLAIRRLEPFQSENSTSGNEIEQALIPVILAWSHYANGENEAAMELLHTVQGNHFKSFLTYQKAVLASLTGQVEMAKTEFTALLEENPDTPFRIVREVASFYDYLGESEKAHDLISVFEESNPTFSAIELGGGKNHAFIRHIQGAAAAKAYIADALTEVGGLMYAVQRLEDAEIYLRLAVYLDTGSESARLLLGNLLQKTGQYIPANEVYAGITEHSPFYRRARIAMAMNLHRLDHTPDARARLLSLSEESPKAYDAFLHLADLLLSEKEYEEAANIYSRAIARIPAPQHRHWAIYYARGIAYERQKRWDQAEPDFLKALELSPDEPDVLNYLAYTWLIMGRNIEQAETMLKTAIKLRPNDAHIVDSYGWAMFQMGRYEEALSYLEKANLLMPQDATVNDHLGDVFWKLGRRLEARYQWKRALKYDPPEEEIPLIRAKLEHGITETDMQAAQHLTEYNDTTPGL